jgi:hypothetical protein
LVSLIGDVTALQASTRGNSRRNTSPLTSLSSGTFGPNDSSAGASPTGNLTSSSCDTTNTKRRKKLWDLLDNHRAKQTWVLQQGACGSLSFGNITLAFSFL